MTLKEFTPGIMGRDILRPHTRKAIADWLKTKPTTLDGKPIVAVCQDLFCEPVDLDPLKDPVAVASFEFLSVRVSDISPLVHHDHGYSKLWSGAVIDDHMKGFRDPHFMLTHDETYTRLLNSDLMVLADPAGSSVHLYHFEHGSVMMSTELANRIAAEDWRKGDWQGALVTAILPRAESHHELLTRAKQVDQLNELILPLFCSASDNFEELKPAALEVDFKKFS